MIEGPALLGYLAACLGVVLAPGPAQALVLSRALGEGRRAGVLTAVGLNVGTLLHALAAGLGLSALLATSATAFAALRFAGAAYLVILGLGALRASPAVAVRPEAPAPGPSRAFTRAVAIGVLNPKVALFLLAFVPPFVDPARGPVLAQFAVLGAILALIDVAYEVLLVAALLAVGDRLLAPGPVHRWRQRVTGTVLLGLGVRLAS